MYTLLYWVFLLILLYLNGTFVAGNTPSKSMRIQKEAYSGPLQPEKYGLKLKVAVKWRDIYIEIIVALLMVGLTMQGILK